MGESVRRGWEELGEGVRGWGGAGEEITCMMGRVCVY